MKCLLCRNSIITYKMKCLRTGKLSNFLNVRSSKPVRNSRTIKRNSRAIVMKCFRPFANRATTSNSTGS